MPIVPKPAIWWGRAIEAKIASGDDISEAADALAQHLVSWLVCAMKEVGHAHYKEPSRSLKSLESFF